MDRFDLVIFDCDGVLVDSEPLACQCLADMLVEHGVPSSLDHVFEHFLGRSFDAVAAHYERVAGRPLPEGFRGELLQRQVALFQASLRTMPHVTDVLDRLGRPYCLASSSDGERLSATLAASGLDVYFGDRVYTAAMVQNGKPAPDLFLHAAAAMRARPERTLVIEDTPSGIRAGKAAGMTVWAFVGGSHYRGRDLAEVLRAGADRVFRSMAEFTAMAGETT